MRKPLKAQFAASMARMAFLLLFALSTEPSKAAPGNAAKIQLPSFEQVEPTPFNELLFTDTSLPNLEMTKLQEDFQKLENSLVPAASSETEAEPEQEPNPPEKVAESLEQKMARSNLPEPTAGWNSIWIDSPCFGTEQLAEFSGRSLSLSQKLLIRPHLNVATFYDTNIFIRPDGEEGDSLVRIAPGIAVGLGGNESRFQLLADYTLGFVLFADHGSEDNIDQEFKLGLRVAFPKTNLDFRASVFDNYGTSIDVTSRVHRLFYDFGMGVSHVLSEKLSLNIDTDFSFTDYQGYIASRQAQAQAFLNYTFSPKLTLGLGATLGHQSVEEAADQVFEQGNLRIIYQPTVKLALNAMLGIELRQFGEGGGDTFSPVWNIGAAWQVLNGTSVTVNLNRRVFASSLLVKQNYTATEINCSIVQRVTDRASLILGGGYLNSDYRSAASGVEATRTDDFFYLRPALQFYLFKWLNLGLFYEFSKNASAGEGKADSFERSRGGVQVSITY